MKTFAAMAIVSMAALVALSACKKEEPAPVPVISITTQPASPAALTEGSISGSLTVAASVTEGAALSYQWYTNTTASSTGGTAISGATGASYTLPADLTDGTYHYFCEVSAEGADSKRTDAATVTVNARPVPVISIATQPVPPTGLVEGEIPDDAQLTVAATVTPGATLSYQWYTYNNENEEVFEAIDGATGASYTLPTDLAAGEHWYVCEIAAEGAASVQTDPVSVTISPAAAIDSAELVGKWEVGDNSLGIVSVEFGGSNNYVVVTNAELPTRAEEEFFTYFGTYTVAGDKVIMSDLGEMTITSLGESGIAFSLAIYGGSAVSMSGGKAQEMASSSKTDLLCRTWKVVSYEEDGVVYYESNEEFAMPEFVYFSKAGTYLLTFSNGSTGLSNWKWKSESAGTFYYSHEHPPVWNDSSVTIETLDENSLAISEWGGITTLEAVE